MWPWASISYDLEHTVRLAPKPTGRAAPCRQSLVSSEEESGPNAACGAVQATRKTIWSGSGFAFLEFVQSNVPSQIRHCMLKQGQHSFGTVVRDVGIARAEDVAQMLASLTSEMAWIASFGFLAVQLCWLEAHLARVMLPRRREYCPS